MTAQTPNPTKCAHQSDAGACEAWALEGSTLCFFHDPAQAEQRALAQSKGGQRSHRQLAGLPDVQPPQTPQSIADTMAQVIAGVLRGEVDPRIANSAAYCAATLIKAIEISDLERRVDALERANESERRK
jgi:hypothetical protein